MPFLGAVTWDKARSRLVSVMTPVAGAVACLEHLHRRGAVVLSVLYEPISVADVKTKGAVATPIRHLLAQATTASNPKML